MEDLPSLKVRACGRRATKRLQVKASELRAKVGQKDEELRYRQLPALVRIVPVRI